VVNASTGVEEVTAHLAHLSVLEHPVEQTSMGIDAALHGRGAVIALSRQVLADVLGTDKASSVDLSTLHSHPERVLARALRVGVREARNHSPAEVSAAVHPRSPSAAWERLGAAATQAHVAWTQSPGIPSGPEGRAAIADIAVLALGVAHLDRRLVQAATHAGADDVARDLGVAEGAGLHLSARSVIDRFAPAASSWGTRLPRPMAGLAVLPVSTPEDLPLGLQRLREMLESEAGVSPQHTLMLITAQVRMTTVLAEEVRRVARATGDNAFPGLLSQLTDHASELAGSWGRADRSLASRARSDPRPVRQAGECLRCLARGPQPIETLRATAASVVDLARSTADAVEASVKVGSWVTYASRGENQQAMAWRVLDRHEPPSVLDALRSAVTRAATTAQAPAPLANRNRPVPGPVVVMTRS